ncbi:integrase arm-type DNA-binding domain-containing protein [Mesorhizobium sp. VK22B]|uniref:Integrase arm-type DNA-binding domain-containing protein n=1 Tax=Mesorhizobium captivum TaxID=3072319 RepID=A0ABU4Z0F2_9HYPH|nr:integrase arm-type DNA-binding domain-containing protein [Mesorhizobium sp. VK22B]MDX8492700.1 integrase arm-type DNA-binding domain-containing protein [Mesorhizobium sp. VK22B]
MALTTLKVKHAGPGRHADLHGLYLLVRESGTRSWVLRMQHAGQRRDFGLGPAHDVPLADARILAADLRRAVRAGIDPPSRRRATRKSAPTFEKVTRDCYDAMKGGWKDQRHASWMSSFERHVFPHIGGKAVTAVDSAAVLSVLEPIWLTIPDTAKRVLQRIGTVMDFAHIKGLVPDEVSLRSVTRGLPRQTRRATHRAAMPHEDAPAFMKTLSALPSTLGRDALRLTVLTAVRSNEARKATWAEFDLDKAVWSIPAARMKMKEAHVVPLAPATVKLLRALHQRHLALHGEVKPESLLFSFTGDKPISDMTMLKVLRDMKVGNATVHGFRSTFTDWVAECTNVPKEVADKALAHRIANAVEAAYRRTDFFDRRRVLMNEWAEFLLG